MAAYCASCRRAVGPGWGACHFCGADLSEVRGDALPRWTAPRRPTRHGDDLVGWTSAAVLAAIASCLSGMVFLMNVSIVLDPDPYPISDLLPLVTGSLVPLAAGSVICCGDGSPTIDLRSCYAALPPP